MEKLGGNRPQKVFSFCDFFLWRVLGSYSEHLSPLSHQLPSSMGFFRKSDNISERKLMLGDWEQKFLVCSQPFGLQDICLWALIWRQGELGCSQISCSGRLRAGCQPPWCFNLCWMRMRKPESCSRNWCTTNQQEIPGCLVPDESLTMSSDLSTICQICMFLCKVFVSSNIQCFIEPDSETGQLQSCF